MSRRSPRLRVVLGLVVVSAAVAWGIVAPAAAQPDNPTRIDLAAGAPLRDGEAQLLAGETVQFRQQHGPQAVATAVGAYFTSGDPRLAVIAVALDWREAGRLAAERIDGSDSPGDRAALLLLRIALGRPLEVEASGQVRVAAGPPILPAASSGHGRIAYWQQVGDRRELRLAGPGLAAPRLVLVSEEPRSATFPGRAMEWSPSGETLAFRGIRGGRSRLYVVSASGVELRCLTPPGQSEYDPCWSPDGRWLAAVDASEETAQAWLVRPDGSDRLPLILDRPGSAYPDETPLLAWDTATGRLRYGSSSVGQLALNR